MSDGATTIGSTPTDARRRWLVGAVAAGAAAAGAGLAWWRFRPGDVDQAGAAEMWGLSFDTPAGSPLQMATFRGRPLLVNFWATWCAPCIEEMPLLDGFFRQHAAKGWQVVGLAIDQPSQVRKFLERAPVSFPIGLAGFGGTELTKTLGNTSGGLPFSVVFDAEGRVRQRRIGRLSEADLRDWSGLA